MMDFKQIISFYGLHVVSKLKKHGNKQNLWCKFTAIKCGKNSTIRNCFLNYCGNAELCQSSFYVSFFAHIKTFLFVYSILQFSSSLFHSRNVLEALNRRKPSLLLSTTLTI